MKPPNLKPKPRPPSSDPLAGIVPGRPDLEEFPKLPKPIDPGFAVPIQAIQSAEMLDLHREHLILQKAIWEEERELAKASLWYFITECLYPDNAETREAGNSWRLHYTEEFHKPLIDSLQDLPPGEDWWAFLQREARKSFLFDMAHNAWLIVKDQNIRILVAGARKETVIPFARLQRSMFVLGTPGYGKFQSLFPEFCFQPGDKQLKQVQQFTVPTRSISLPDPTFRATYLGVTGAGWRCDVLKFDDPVERRNVFTPESSLKTLGQMLDLIPLVSKTSKYRNTIGMGTRWAYHDPYGFILGETEDIDDADAALDRLIGRKIRIVIRHAIEDPTKLCEHCPAQVTIRSPHGHPLAPEDIRGVVPLAPIHTRESLLTTLNQYRVDPQKGESLWWHQYNNVCVAPKNQKFKKEWFELVLDKPSWPVPKKKVLAIDSADKDFQKKGVGDYMVALMGDFDDIGRLALRYGLRSNKWTRDQFLQRVLAWCQGTGWWPQLVIKEKFGEDNFLSDVSKRFREAYHPTHVHAISRPSLAGAVMKKMDWIVDTIQAPMERGEVVFGSAFPEEIRGRAQYEGENLSQTSHDDVIDDIALFFSEGVRPKRLINQAMSIQNNWQAPNLGLYEPGEAPAPQVPGMQGGTTLKTPRLSIAVDDMGFSQVTWDPQNAPQRILFDE